MVATEPPPLTLSQAVHRAVEACDPNGGDDVLADFLTRFEDRDEPIAAVPDVEQEVAETVGALDPDGDDPALAVAGAIVTYLAYRRDSVRAPDDRLIQLAVDAEFDGHPPPSVEDWMRGVD
jgi:hypothetical protein